MTDEVDIAPAPAEEQPSVEEASHTEETKVEEVQPTEDIAEDKAEESKDDVPKTDEKLEDQQIEEPKSESVAIEESEESTKQTVQKEAEEEKVGEIKSEEAKEGIRESIVSVAKDIQSEEGELVRSEQASQDVQQRSSKTVATITEERTSSIERTKSELPIASSGSLEKKAGRDSWKEDKETKKSHSEKLSTKAKYVIGSTISIRRLSPGAEFFDRAKGARYMNSYKLDSDNPFKPDKVQTILESVMLEAMENLTYDPEKCPKQAKWASSTIRAKVRELQFDRYKLICIVTFGEKNSQDVLVTCRFLWDADRDRYATYITENTYVFGIAQCYGVYYE